MKSRGGSKLPAGHDSWSSDEQAGEAALNWAVGSRTVDCVLREVEVEMGRVRRRRIRAAAVGLAAMFVAGSAWYGTLETRTTVSPAPAAARSSSAIVVLPARQVLPDGSVVELRDAAAIAVNFTDTLREVTLVRGEAHFQVAKDGVRPFVVAAGEVEVRAVGTAFSVQLGTSLIEVLVTEGQVAVVSERRRQRTEDQTGSSWDREWRHRRASPGAGGLESQPPAVRPPTREVVVNKGSRVVIEAAAPSTGQPAVQPVSGSELQEKLSWRVPRLEFSGTPLTEVIALFNQHGGLRLALGDPAIGRLKLSGVLRADNENSLLQILKFEFGIMADRRGEETILVLTPQERR